MDNSDKNEPDEKNMRELLLGSGYAEKAITYYLEKKNMGSLPDANQITELTGQCGDTMKIYLKIEDNRIKDAKIQVLGCPGAIASAMAAMDLIRGRTLDEAKALKDGDIYRELEDVPDQKNHCIMLTNNTIHKAIHEYVSNNK